ncbi:hypothetical protein G9464_13900 [Halostella sp. JP-L12]|uniref:DUF5799 family protein n=1 Tax=Halostella TaxID=1843185 RepID=UPI000EF7E8DA|nr:MULTISPECIES: DUF5799 family protein [Halostella]NHN48680.1 hypothetical protein [Halostella sp. JP-L12]
MADSEWTDRIVGDRMTVDQEFSQHVRNSQFSNQEWGMIMTAVELEIENPDDPEAARIVADTSKIGQVLPAIEESRSKMGQMGGAGGGGAGGASSGGGFLDGIKNALGLGGGSGGNDERERAAVSLAQDYADELQSHLEQRGKWEEIRTVAQR